MAEVETYQCEVISLLVHKCFPEYPQMSFKYPLESVEMQICFCPHSRPSVPLVAQTLPSRFALCTPSPTCRCAPPFPCTRKRKTQWVSAVFCFLFTCWSSTVTQKTDRHTPVPSTRLTFSLSHPPSLFLPRSHRCLRSSPQLSFVASCAAVCSRTPSSPPAEWVTQPSPHFSLRIGLSVMIWFQATYWFPVSFGREQHASLTCFLRHCQAVEHHSTSVCWEMNYT